MAIRPQRVPIKKNTETFIVASKDVGVEINVAKTKYVLLSRHQEADQNWGIILTDCLKYIRTTATNKDLFQEERMKRLNSGNACFHSLQDLLIC
jgi:hypothetical protein